ncbi:hypothetical protein PS3A_55890 [Pseudomonas sp. 3A(2025)]
MLRVAVELFAAHGYSAIGLRELARQLNLHAGSLYYHFESKQDLLFELIESALSDLLNVTLRHLKQCVAPAQRLRVFMDVFVRFRASDGQRLELVVREYLHLNNAQKAEIDRLKARYEALLQSSISPRSPGNAQTGLLSSLIVGMLFNGWNGQGAVLESDFLTRLVQSMLVSQTSQEVPLEA